MMRPRPRRTRCGAKTRRVFAVMPVSISHFEERLECLDAGVREHDVDSAREPLPPAARVLTGPGRVKALRFAPPRRPGGPRAARPPGG